MRKPRGTKLGGMNPKLYDTADLLDCRAIAVYEDTGLLEPAAKAQVWWLKEIAVQIAALREELMLHRPGRQG